VADAAPTDRDLLAAWAAGDARAGETFVERHFDGLYRFFANHVDHEIADLVQRTFVACIAKRDRFPEHVSVRAFLYGIAHKELLMTLRKLAREREAVRAVAGDQGRPTSPSTVVALREEERLLAIAVQRLPLELQILIELFYWEELSVADVALVLEVPEGTVKSRLHRAREQLRREMQDGGAAAALVETTISGLDRWAVALRESWQRQRADDSAST
jgi:RNA polymerase sigma factor (sigma-70 family)